MTHDPLRFIKLSGNEELWKDAKTLKETVYELYRDGKASTPEFKSLVSYYGRERVKRMIHEERVRRSKVK